MKLDNETLQYFARILDKLDVSFLQCEIETVENGFVAVWGLPKYNPFSLTVEGSEYLVTLQIVKVDVDETE